MLRGNYLTGLYWYMNHGGTNIRNRRRNRENKDPGGGSGIAQDVNGKMTIGGG
jgi:hypothetical protein